MLFWGVFFLIFLLWILYTWQLDCNYELSFLEKFGKSVDSLSGKVIWVTGASSGIGEALAVCLAKAGCKLALSARAEANLIKVKSKCLDINPNLDEKDVLVLPFDLASTDQHTLALHTILKHFTSLDVLVNNAGLGQAGEFEHIELSLDRALFETNVFAPLHLTRLVCKHWMRTGHAGLVLLNSSTSSIIRNPWSSAYVASKAAITAYFKCAEKEFMHVANIRFSIAYPGPIDTGIFERSLLCKLGDQPIGDFRQSSQSVGVFQWISPERCAHLIVLAIANQTRECWIARQPILALTFIAHFLPFLDNKVWSVVLKKKRETLKRLYVK